MQKQDTTNPKQKNNTYLRTQLKSQNRNEHPKAETHTKQKYKIEPQNWKRI